jgi:hypothetical protein
MKLKTWLSLIIILLITTVKVHAQGGFPCGETDPDATCPLDTWVIVLVVLASAFAAFTLFKKRKAICA